MGGMVLAEIIDEYRDEAIEERLGNELEGATGKTVSAVVAAARAVEEELGAALAKMKRSSDAHENLRQALLALDREILR